VPPAAQLVHYRLIPPSSGGLRKESLAVAAVINALPASASPLSLARALSALIDRPAEALLRLVNRRKVRVLLRSKRSFLNSVQWIDRIAAIFSIKRQYIQQSLAARK